MFESEKQLALFDNQRMAEKEAICDKTIIPITSITSLSGGKTSCYMAVKFPTDQYVFALVKTLDRASIPKDKGLLREIKNRIPDFVASRELDQTLVNVLRLEQKLGKKIDWVSSHLTYDELIDEANYLPNQVKRFCTTKLKLFPIFQYCYNLSDLVIMNIGFRYDERNRLLKLLSNCKKAYSFKFPFLCQLRNKKQKYKEVEYRIPNFPLVDNKISHLEIIKFWQKENWIFPEVSNCDFCFFHQISEMRTQLKQFPDRFDWWIKQEEKIGASFHKNFAYEDILDPNKSIKKTPLYSCYCTD